MFLVCSQNRKQDGVCEKETDSKFTGKLQAQVQFLSLPFPERDGARSTVGSAILTC